MGEWFKDVKDSDKVGLLILFTGICVALLSSIGVIVIALTIKQESVLDKILVNLAGFGAIGTGLVTAAMGVLRFQSKSDTNGNGKPPAATDKP